MAKSKGRAARRKGHNFEREMANKLKDATGYHFHRGLGQTRSGGTETADVMCDGFKDILHIECKRQKRVNIKAAYQQAVGDAPDRTKVIITKNDREPIMVTMEFDEWLPLFKLWLDSAK